MMISVKTENNPREIQNLSRKLKSNQNPMAQAENRIKNLQICRIGINHKD